MDPRSPDFLSRAVINNSIFPSPIQVPAGRLLHISLERSYNTWAEMRRRLKPCLLEPFRRATPATVVCSYLPCLLCYRSAAGRLLLGAVTAPAVVHVAREYRTLGRSTVASSLRWRERCQAAVCTVTLMRRWGWSGLSSTSWRWWEVVVVEAWTRVEPSARSRGPRPYIRYVSLYVGLWLVLWLVLRSAQATAKRTPNERGGDSWTVTPHGTTGHLVLHGGRG